MEHFLEANVSERDRVSASALQVHDACTTESLSMLIHTCMPACIHIYVQVNEIIAWVGTCTMHMHWNTFIMSVLCVTMHDANIQQEKQRTLPRRRFYHYISFLLIVYLLNWVYASFSTFTKLAVLHSHFPSCIFLLFCLLFLFIYVSIFCFFFFFFSVCVCSQHCY